MKVALVALLILAAGCAGVAPEPVDVAAAPQPVPEPHLEEEAGDPTPHELGMHRPAFPPAKGKVPTAKEAAELPQVSMLRFIGDVDLESSGYVEGAGTLADPYVIQGYYVAGDLMLQDTDAFVIIKENWVGGQLTLNWNAQNVHVHHNHINDLRVNENIRRDGYATGGLMERNEIGYIGQLRHYDGEFRFNTVGPMPPGGPYDDVQETVPYDFVNDPRIANIDGFNQALIHNNTFHGSVDLDFHGHHHGTGFFAPHSHYHGDEPENKTEHQHDHTLRWTQVSFRDNTIVDPDGYGVRYEDRNHAGDDRTARSEQEETLADPHRHWTLVDIIGNHVDGAGLWVDVFNANDQLHEHRNDGWLNIQHNTVILRERDRGPAGVWGPDWQPMVGFQILSTKELWLVLSGNHAEFHARDAGPLDIRPMRADPIAYQIRSVHDADLRVTDNTATGFAIGLQARQFDDVTWLVDDNDFGDAERPTDYDDSVP